MHTLNKRPSEYTAQELMVILSGNDVQLLNLSNINQCLDWIAKSDTDMLSPDKFAPVMAAMQTVSSQLKKPDDSLELREQQQIIGNILMYLNRLLTLPMIGNIAGDFYAELQQALTLLVDYFLEIHQGYNVADDVRLFDALTQLDAAYKICFLDGLNKENYLMFAAQCSPQLSRNQCYKALAQYDDMLSAREAVGCVASSEAVNIAALFHHMLRDAKVIGFDALLHGLSLYKKLYDRDASLLEQVPIDDITDDITNALAELLVQCDDPALSTIDDVIDCFELFVEFDRLGLYRVNLTGVAIELCMQRLAADMDGVLVDQLDSIMKIYLDYGDCDQDIFKHMIYSYLEKAIRFADEENPSADDILYCMDQLAIFLNAADATTADFPDDFTAGMESLERFYVNHPDVSKAPEMLEIVIKSEPEPEPAEKPSMAQLLWQRGLLSPMVVPPLDDDVDACSHTATSGINCN
ncbi:MAG: hypothetical protein P1U34_07520 [Coxiellaceae bacterium]|nr:hypothetical protein [Coxiellaceae bacterium]